MKENLDSWTKITNQWLKYWAESSAIAWKNWSILMGLHSTSSSQQLPNSFDDYLQQLVSLTKKSHQIEDWQSLQKLWLELADILLSHDFDDTSQKISKLAHDLEAFSLTYPIPKNLLEDGNNFKRQINTSKNLDGHQAELYKKDNTVDSPELFTQVQWLQQQLNFQESKITELNNQIITSETKIEEKAKEYWLLEQDHRQQSQTIEQLQAKIEQLENNLPENQAESSPKNSFLDSSEVFTQVQSLQQQLNSKEFKIAELNNQITTRETKIAEKTKEYWLLEQENQKKLLNIEQLKAKITELERVAPISNRQLNKWRFRTFSS